MVRKLLMSFGLGLLSTSAFALKQEAGVRYWVAAQGSYPQNNVVSFVYGTRSCKLQEAIDTAIQACKDRGLLRCNVGLIKQDYDQTCLNPSLSIVE